jgi:hypothetical protein
MQHESLVIIGKPSIYRLMLRRPIAQGTNPDYIPLHPLTDQEASALAASGLIQHLYGDPIEAPAGEEALKPSDVLTLREDDRGRWELVVVLPPYGLRRRVVEFVLSDWTERLNRRRASGQITADQIRHFVHKTGISLAIEDLDRSVKSGVKEQLARRETPVALEEVG